MSSPKRRKVEEPATALPATMRAAVWRGDPDPEKMTVETLKTPSPKTDEVLIKVKACGVCHTDLHCIKGQVPFPKPAVFGHELCGEVVAYGPLTPGAASSQRHPLPIGTKVISPFIMPCASCSFCKRGEEDTCETFFKLNRGKGHLYDDTTRLLTEAAQPEEVAMYAHARTPSRYTRYSFAGMAEYAVVPVTAVFELPAPLLRAGLYAESCVLGCAFFTAFGAIRNAAGIEVTPGGGSSASGRSACVIGCGGVGGSLLQLLKHLGLSPIIAVDVSDDALAQAKALGADHTVNSATEGDAVSQIAALTDGVKVDYCFEVIGLKQTFEQAVMAVRDGGKACFIGISDVRNKAEVPITHIVRRRISLVGSYGARASRDMPALLELASAGAVDLKGGITRRFTLEQAGEAYRMLMERKIVGRGIVCFD